jgi:P-type E1-E2 ATPase
LRDGTPQLIPAEEIVLGDIVLLSAGSLIPADGIVLEARDFFVDQAVLTGETFPVEKSPALSKRARWASNRVASRSLSSLVTFIVCVPSNL